MNKKDFKKLIKEIVENEMDNVQGMQNMMDVHKDKLLANLDTFTDSYIKAAIWSSTDNLEDNGGNPLDKKYTEEDLEISTLEKMISDCAVFQKKFSEIYEQGGWSDADAGHDFWLTRNGHGTGFWDRGYNDPEKEEIGKILTKCAKSFGTYDLYLGDGKYDGLICGG